MNYGAIPRAPAPGVRVQNWMGAVTYYAHSVEKIRTVEDLQRIVCDPVRYPSPVRPKGSHHSKTGCIEAEGGTVCDLSGFNKILNIDRENLTITMQAGVILIDAAKELEKAGLQFYINLELGNLTMGAGATSATKDASYFNNGEWELGIFSSYCIGMKTVQPDGSLLEVTEDSDAELLAAMRTGYGMLGIAYEVTFRVKEISAIAMEHESFSVDEFADRLDELVARNKSMMMYFYPFLDRVVVEWRYDSKKPLRPGSRAWAIRNFTWSKLWPFMASVFFYIPFRFLRHWITNALNLLTGWFQTRIMRDDDSSPADQIIRYGEVGGFASFTFSIWGFPRHEFPQTLRKYYAFCKKYYRENGYRCDLLNVGYHLAQDRSSLFSYARDWPVLTLDPVSTGRTGWEGFLYAYNEFCVQHNGRPLFNQTPSLTPLQAMKSFGPEIAKFKTIRARVDPGDRFMNNYFRYIFSEVKAEAEDERTQGQDLNE